MLTYDTDEAENFSEKDLSLISYVVPQKMLVCIAMFVISDGGKMCC